LARHGRARQGKETKKGKSMEKTTAYPMDFDQLEKGSVITAEQLEQITGFDRKEAGFSLAVMRFSGRVTREMGARGIDVVTRVKKNKLHILEDDEASTYTAERGKIFYRGMCRSLRRMAYIDQANLGDKQRKRHERAVHILGHMVLGARKGRGKAIKAMEYKRDTPRVLEGNSMAHSDIKSKED